MVVQQKQNVTLTTNFTSRAIGPTGELVRSRSGPEVPSATFFTISVRQRTRGLKRGE